MKNTMFNFTQDAIQNWSRKGGYLSKSDAALCAIAVNLAVIADCLKEAERPVVKAAPKNNYELVTQDVNALAHFFAYGAVCGGGCCPPSGGCDSACEDCWREWLNEEVVEG